MPFNLGKIKKNIGVFFSIGFISFCVLISIFSYFIIPDDSQYSNQMHLEINSKPPGFKTCIIEIPVENNKNQLSDFFLGNRFPNKEIVVKEYDLKKNGIQILDYKNEVKLLDYNFNAINNLKISGNPLKFSFMNINDEVKKSPDLNENKSEILKKIK